MELAHKSDQPSVFADPGYGTGLAGMARRSMFS